MKLTTRLLGAAAAVVGVTITSAVAARFVAQMTVPDVVDASGATTLPNDWRVKPAGTAILTD